MKHRCNWTKYSFPKKNIFGHKDAQNLSNSNYQRLKVASNNIVKEHRELAIDK